MERRGPDPDSLNTIQFTTERLVIDVPDEGDVDQLFDLIGGEHRDEICATLIWDGPDDRSDTEWWVDACRTKPFGEWGYHWVLRDRTGDLTGELGTALGAIGTRPLGAPGRVDVGYWLGQPFWGRGLMSEALAALVDLIARDLDCVKIEAHVFAHNEASRGVVERVGFEAEGLVRRAHLKRGVWVDECLYGIVL